MKYISKGEQPESFEGWLQTNTDVAWGDFSGLHYEVYCNLRNQLLEQQNNVCCYCEIALKNEKDAHIEHLKPRNQFSCETYSFLNLLASCRYTDSCGHQKGRDYFSDFISPLGSTCQNRFTYTRRGNVIPFEETDTHAERTIALLGLNCKRLKDQRESIIKCLEKCELEVVTRYLENCFEWVNGFSSVVEYVASKK